MASIKIIGLDEAERFMIRIKKNAEDSGLVVKKYANKIKSYAGRIARKGPYSKGRGAAYKAQKGKTSKTLTEYKIVPTARRYGFIYGNVLEGGAKPHTIRAKNGRYLKYHDKDGNLRFSRVVQHPGVRNPPRPLGKAMNKYASEMIQELNKQILK